MNTVPNTRRPPRPTVDSRHSSRRGLRAARASTALVAGATLLSGPLAAQVGSAPPGSLAEAVARALEVHPSIEAATAATEAADAGLRAARATRLPSVAVDGSVVRFEEPMLVAPLHRFDPTAVPDFDATLVRGTMAAQYTLFDGGRRGAEVQRARSLVAAGEAARRDAAANLAQRTAEAYLSVLAAREVVAAQARRESALEAEVDRARQFLREGAAPRLEVLRAEAELSSVQADGEAARRRLDLAVTTLGRLLDVAPAELRNASLDEPGLPTGPPPALLPADTAGSEVLDRSPAVARARSAARAADAGVAAARSAWLPSVDAQVGYTLYAGGSVDAVAEWQAGVSVRYPVFTGGVRAGAVQRARADAVRADAEARVIREEVARAADAARTAELEARSRVAALEAAVTRFAELARVERLALDEGAGTQSDWLRAEAGLFQARAGLADARYAVIRARVAWGRAVGRLDLDWIDSLMEVTP